MSSQTNILQNTRVCKEKTCPVCGKTDVLLDGDPGFSTYSCNNADCVVKNCSEPWFLHLASDGNIGEMLLLSVDRSDLSELGKRKNRAELLETKTCAERISLFHSEIENGILRKMDDIGYPCSSLDENVLGAIGLVNSNRKLASSVEFMYFDGNGISAAETCTKKPRVISGKPGAFPIKTHKIEPTIYVFPSPKEVLVARSLWKNAGLGEFPAYSFTMFPLPDMFRKTKKIVFVDVNGKIAAPGVLASAIRSHREGVSISGKIRLNIDGLRSIFIEEPDATLKPKPAAHDKLIAVGKTAKDEPVYFSKHGYMVLENGYSTPTLKTNFAFCPTRTIVSNYPVSRKMTTVDVYVDGNLGISGLVIPENKLDSMTKMKSLADSVANGTKMVVDAATFRGAKFEILPAKRDSFPLVPCVDRSCSVVFPGFRLCKNGFDPHPELEKIMLGIRENLDYWAMKPEHGTKQDLVDFARLFSEPGDSYKAAVLGICAWLHSAVSGIIEMSCGVQFHKLCFEIHCKTSETPPSVTFLSLLFSGNPEPGNNLEYRKCYMKSHVCSGSTTNGALFESLPGLFKIDAANPSKSAAAMYYKTSSSGLYAVVNSGMSYPVNAHGNIQCAISDCGTEELSVNMPGIRRSLLHILWKYVQTGPKINPDKWISKRPELSMYELVSAALREFGVNLPGKERFSDMYLGKK